MAAVRALLAAQRITRAGLVPSFAAVGTSGISFLNSGEHVLWLRNTSGSACTAQFTAGPTVDGQPAAARTVTVPASTGNVVVGPFTTTLNRSDGTVYVDFTAPVTAAVIGY